MLTKEKKQDGGAFVESVCSSLMEIQKPPTTKVALLPPRPPPLTKSKMIAKVEGLKPSTPIAISEIPF